MLAKADLMKEEDEKVAKRATAKVISFLGYISYNYIKG